MAKDQHWTTELTRSGTGLIAVAIIFTFGGVLISGLLAGVTGSGFLLGNTILGDIITAVTTYFPLVLEAVFIAIAIGVIVVALVKLNQLSRGGAR